MGVSDPLWQSEQRSVCPSGRYHRLTTPMGPVMCPSQWAPLCSPMLIYLPHVETSGTLTDPNQEKRELNAGTWSWAAPDNGSCVRTAFVSALARWRRATAHHKGADEPGVTSSYLLSARWYRSSLGRECWTFLLWKDWPVFTSPWQHSRGRNVKAELMQTWGAEAEHELKESVRRGQSRFWSENLPSPKLQEEKGKKIKNPDREDDWLVSVLFLAKLFNDDFFICV